MLEFTVVVLAALLACGSMHAIGTTDDAQLRIHVDVLPPAALIVEGRPWEHLGSADRGMPRGPTIALEGETVPDVPLLYRPRRVAHPASPAANSTRTVRLTMEFANSAATVGPQFDALERANPTLLRLLLPAGEEHGDDDATIVDSIAVGMCVGRRRRGEPADPWCPAPGAHVFTCASDQRRWSAEAEARIHRVGERLSEELGAWPLEYLLPAPSGRRNAGPRRHGVVADVHSGATPLYRRMAAARFRTTAKTCVAAQTLSPFAPCSNTLFKVLTASLPLPLARAVDVANSDGDLLAQVLRDGSTTEEVTTLLAACRALNNTLPTVVDEGFDRRSPTVRRVSHRAQQMIQAGSASPVLPEVIDLVEAIAGAASYVSVKVDLGRSSTAPEGRATLRGKTVLQADFTKPTTVQRILHNFQGAQGQGSTGSTRVTCTSPAQPDPNTCNVAHLHEPQPPPQQHQQQHQQPRAVEAVSNQGVSLDGLIESRGEHRGRLRAQVQVPALPTAASPSENDFIETFNGQEVPVVGAIDVAVFWPLQLYRPHIHMVRLAPHVGYQRYVEFSPDAPRWPSNWSAFGNPCLGQPIVLGEELHDAGGVVQVAVRVPLVEPSGDVCAHFLRYLLSQQEEADNNINGGRDAVVRLSVDLLIDFSYRHLHADEYAPDMNRYYLMPSLTTRVGRERRSRYMIKHGEALPSPPAAATALHGWFDSLAERVVKREANVPSRLAVLDATSPLQREYKLPLRRRWEYQWRVSTHRGLAVSPPIPDRAMPFNVLGLWGGILALLLMGMLNIAVRGVITPPSATQIRRVLKADQDGKGDEARGSIVYEEVNRWGDATV